MITVSRNIGALLDGMLTENTEVSLLFKLFSFGRDNLDVRDNSDAFVSIQSLIFNLSLEWEAFDLSEINVFHFNKLWDLFQTVFKSDFGILSHITEVSDQERVVFRQQGFILISKLETFV